MRTKEFIKKVKELGFRVQELNNIINVCNYEERVYLVTIDKHNQFMLDNRCKGYMDLGDYDKSELLKLCYEYAKTPIEEREEPKKYFLKHKWMGHEKLKYLELDKQNDEWYLGHKYDTIFCTAKNEFTQKEIEEIKEKYNTDLSDFEMIEVEE